MEEKKEATSTVVAKQFVNARELHKILNPPVKFGAWIQRKIEEYGFTEEDDYFTDDYTKIREQKISLILSLSSFSKDCDNPQLETVNYEIEPRLEHKDYLVTLDMAKELAMVEKSDVGRKVRRYFIDVEKRFKEISENLAKRQRERFSLKNELARIETQMSVYSLRKKEITKELDAIDNDMFIQLELFPRS